MRWKAVCKRTALYLMVMATVLTGQGWVLSQAHAEGDSAVPFEITYYSAGVQAYRSNDYARAINYFRRVLLDEGGANINAQYYMAVCFDKLNLTNEAIAAYRYVVAHGEEERIVQYAQSRLKVLQPQQTTDGTSADASHVAMIAAGGRTVPAVYRGSLSQIAVPLKNNKNALMVDVVSTNGKRLAGGTFIIDTGATYTSISQEMAQKLGLDLENTEKVRITTANGRIEVPKVVIDTLSVNGLEAHNVEATVIQVRPGSSFSGLLGLSFIRQFVLTIDPMANQLIFQRH